VTTESLTPPLGGGTQPEQRAKAVACAFCRRKLAEEYYFTCRRCEASYCYIHMSRHLPARCGLRIPVKVSNPLIVAGSTRGRSSANV
jgi:hypothetical protein